MVLHRNLSHLLFSCAVSSHVSFCKYCIPVCWNINDPRVTSHNSLLQGFLPFLRQPQAPYHKPDAICKCRSYSISARVTEIVYTIGNLWMYTKHFRYYRRAVLFSRTARKQDSIDFLCRKTVPPYQLCGRLAGQLK